MNLGKMGIEICEKLWESLGWRQIGWCRKWDSGACCWAIRGPELHAHSTQSVNQRPETRPSSPHTAGEHQAFDNGDQPFFFSKCFEEKKAFL